MKAILCVVMWLSVSNSIIADGLDLEYVRRQYEKAANDKGICEKMITELSKYPETNVHLAYLGAYQAIWANHTSGVISKFNTFTKGKKNIEKAVEGDRQNVEIRMIRLSVQQNCPAFLNYNDNIAQDRQFLEKHVHAVEPVSLRHMIKELLSK